MSHGFSSIELFVALVFGAGLFAAGLIFTPRSGFVLDQFAQTLIFDLERARFEARTRGSCSGVVVDRSSERYLLFTDIDGDCSFDPDIDLTLARSAPPSAPAVRLVASDGGSVVFAASGATTGPMEERTIAVQAKDRTLLVCIDALGRLRTQERSC